MAYNTATENKDLNAFNAFRNANGNGSSGFQTKELASEYAILYSAWWGSNLVFLGIDEKAGLFYPKFNVFD